MSEFISVVSRPLTQSEMETNAAYIYNYLGSKGWTPNAVAGLLGNLEAESTINPGRYQGDDPSGAGWGLAQWTPKSKYTNWCDERGLVWHHMDSALQRIEWEMENGEQFYATDEYNITFKQFSKSEKEPYWLGAAFLCNYERPASVLYDPDNETYEEHLAKKAKATAARGNNANDWYEYLTGLPAPEMPGTDTKKRKGMSFLLMYLATRRRSNVV